MLIDVLLFGPQAQAVGKRSVEIEIPGDTASVSAVFAGLRAATPELSDSLDASRLAVNHEFADAGQPIHAGDEVALIGMVSGG